MYYLGQPQFGWVRESYCAVYRYYGVISYYETYDIFFNLVSRFSVYRLRKIATAWVAAEQAIGDYIPIETVQAALDGLVVPGRFEVLREEPLLMIDATHNPQAAEYLKMAMEDRFSFSTTSDGATRVNELDTLVLGILADKDARGIIDILTPMFNNLVVTQSTSHRAIPAAELADMVEAYDGRRPVVCATIEEAMAYVESLGVSAMYTGSITVAGESKVVYLQEYAK